MEINTTKVYELNPVSYTGINDNSRQFGLIAEEVADVIPQLVVYTPEKNVTEGTSSEKLIPDGVRYEFLSVLLLKEVQKHEKTIQNQQIQIGVLQETICKLEKESNNFKIQKSINKDLQKQLAEIKNEIDRMKGGESRR